MARMKIRTTALAAALAMALSGPADAARFDYEVDAGIEHNDNVGMDAVDPVSQNIRLAGIGFTVSEDSSALRMLVTGRADYHDYPDVYSDRLDASLRGSLDWAAIPERLHFLVDDTLTTRPVDGLVADAPGNRQRLNVFSMGPTLLFRWTSAVQGALDMRYIRNTAETSDELNATRLSLGLRGIRELDPTSRVSFNLGGQSVDYDDDLLSRDHKRLDGYARYERELARFDVGVDVGWSHLDYDDGESRGDPLFRADLGWRPGARSRFTIAASSQYSDSSIDDIATLQAGTGVPTELPVGDVTPTSSQFEERRLDLGYHFTGVRSTFTISPRVFRARYIDSDTLDHDGRGLRFDASYRLRPTLYLDASATFDEIEYTTLARTDRSRHYGLALRKTWSRHWSTRLAWDRYWRDLPLTGTEVEQDRILLTLVYASR